MSWTAAAEIVKDLELGFEDEVTVAYLARMASVFSGITFNSSEFCHGIALDLRMKRRLRPLKV